MRGGGQPAISPCALVPQELIQPLVPLARLASSSRFRYAVSTCADARVNRRRRAVMASSLARMLINPARVTPAAGLRKQGTGQLQPSPGRPG